MKGEYLGWIIIGIIVASTVALFIPTSTIQASFVAQGVTATTGILTIKDDRQLACDSSVHYQSLCLGILELSDLKNPAVDAILAKRFGFKDSNGFQIIPRPAQ